MSISSIRSGNGGTGAARSPDLSRIAARVVQNLDTNKDGGIDKAEFTAALKAKGVSEDAAAKLFDKIDAKGSGKITQADIEASLKAGGAKGPRPGGGPPPGGMRPRGGKGDGDGDAGKAGSSTQSSAKIYDPADTNQDGSVSSTEALLYSIKNAGTVTTTSGTSQTGTTIDTNA